MAANDLSLVAAIQGIYHETKHDIDNDVINVLSNVGSATTSSSSVMETSTALLRHVNGNSSDELVADDDQAAEEEDMDYNLIHVPAESLDAVTRFLERSGTCWSKQVCQVNNLNDLLQSCHEYCSSDQFTSYLHGTGLKGALFRPFAQRSQTDPAMVKISMAWNSLARTACIAIVFHGTAQPNIPNILKHGLDPMKRSGQAYGAGEYFSKKPGDSVSFCHGGKEMLVFAVVVPDASKRKPRCPADFVVVEDNDRQFPLGTVVFHEVDAQVLNESNAKRSTLRQLSRELHDKVQVMTEGVMYSNIIQHLVFNQPDVAAEKYSKHESKLQEISKRIISFYVHHHVHEDVVPVLFPELPEPLTAQEFDAMALVTVDQREQEVYKTRDEVAKLEKTLNLTSSTAAGMQTKAR